MKIRLGLPKLLFLSGLFLLFSCKDNGKEAITFDDHIAPIIFKNCTPCHRNNGAGPFPLTNYAEVRKHAKMIVKVTGIHFMPPWPADIHYREFEGQKVLTAQEIDLLKQWQKAGCPQGDSSMIVKAPEYPTASRIGKPDLVIKLDKPFKISGNNRDTFLLMKFPYELPNDTFIRCIEFVPDNKRLVHHVNVHMISYEDGKKKTVLTGERVLPSWGFDRKTAYEKMNIPNDDGSYPLLTTSVTNYLPGMEPYYFPDDIGGYRMAKKGAFVVNDIHYGPSPKDTLDYSYINVFFMPHPPKRPVKEVILGTIGVVPVEPPLIIEPNEIKTFKTRLTINQDISLVNVNPHMHLLGKKFVAYALSPAGDTIPIVRINKWDFRWQYVYTFKNLVKIPKGSTIVAEGTFDNTTNNPDNPFNPPQRISEKEQSMKTTDEMFQLILLYLPYQPGDEHKSLTPYKLR